MGDTRTTKFVLDLDAEDFKSGLEKVAKLIEKIGSPEMKGLIDGLKVGAAITGSLIVAVETMKKALDFEMEAENIQQINQSFEILTKQSGIATDALREGLDKAAGGMIADTELLNIANKAIVTMGKSAEKLPELLEMARKSTALFGGDLRTNFENLATAVERGNQRMLKHLGINIDVAAAVKKYADANHLAVNEVNEAGKRQAILNATLEKGKTAFAGINVDTKEATNNTQRFKTSIAELGETFVLVFDKLFGYSIKRATAVSADMASGVKDLMLSFAGTESQKAQLSIRAMQTSIKNMTTEMNHLIEVKAKDARFQDPANQTRLNAEIDTYRNKIDATTKSIEVLKTKESERSPAAGGGEDNANNEAKLKNQAKFQAEMNTLKLQQVRDDMAVEDNEADYAAEKDKERLLMQEQFAAQSAEIQERSDLNSTQKEELIAQRKLKLDQDLEQSKETQYNELVQINDRMVQNSDTAGEGIANGFAAGSRKAALELNNFGAQGQRMFGNLTSHAKQAFIQIGEGQKSAGEIAKQFLFGMLADEAEARGELLLAESIWPPNPLGIAAGGGLLALSGVLRGMGGGGGSSIGGGSAATGGGGGVSGDYLSSSQPNPAQAQSEKKMVNITVAGHYFETEETKTKLVDMIRQANDATDFNISSVGKIT